MTDVGRQSVVDPSGEVGYVGYRGGLREDGVGAVHECLESSGPELESNGPCHDVLGLVGLVEDGQVMFGQDRPFGSQVDPVKVEVGDDDVRHCCRRPRIFGEALVATRAPCCTGALVRTDADRSPGRRRRLPWQVGPVAGVGPVGPVDYHAQFLGVGRLNESIRHTIELLLVAVDGGQFSESLTTDVVGPPLQDGE